MVSYDNLPAAYPGLVEAAIDAEMVGHGFLRAGDEFSDGHQRVLRHGDPHAQLPLDSLATGQFVPAEVFSAWEGAIPQLFDLYVGAPDPADFTAAADRLRLLADRLAAEGGGGDVAHALRRFDGQTAVAFRRYLERLDGTASAQAAAVQFLGVQLEAQAALWSGHRGDVERFVADTERAFRDVVDSAISPETAFDAVGKVCKVLKWVPPTKVPAKIIGKVAKVGELLSHHLDPEPVRFSLSGATARAVWDNVTYSGMPEVDSEVLTAESELGGQLLSLTDLMHTEDSGDDPTFLLPLTSSLAEAQTPGDVVTDQDEVAISREEVQAAVATMRDDLAPLYSAAALDIDPAQLSHAFDRATDLGIGPTGVYPQLADACTYLQGAMRATVEALVGSALVLEAVTDHVGQRDSDIAEAMDAARRKVDERFNPTTYADDRRTPVG